MMDIKLMMKEKEELIKSLAIIKVRKYLSIIDEDEFVRHAVDIYSNKYYCEIVEVLSHRAFDEIIERIDELRKSDFDIKVLFNEKVEVKLRECFVSKICDIVILSKSNMEVIKVLSRESDIINSFECPEMKLLGLGVINKFLSQVNSEFINLTIIQPNILVTSIFSLSIENLLHGAEYTLM
ncbi:DUF2800 domain-containing protein [Clostridium saudiense]|uniref:DUF2800 domain-containing protein n=1 Tax=Clostridium saudiense TaxID=1414720 RepID=UPI0018A883E9|nr:DUF2800 domain-containing protein [Clostridium saudiense]